MWHVVQTFRRRLDLVRNDPLVRSSRNLAEYQYGDGAHELAIGAGYLCFTLGMYAVVLPAGLTTRAVIAGAMVICGLVATWVLPKMIKQRVTWPRTGYAIPRPAHERWWGQGLALLLSLVLASGLCLVWQHLTRPEVREVARPAAASPAATGPGAAGGGAISLRQQVALIGFGIWSVGAYLVVAGWTLRKCPWKRLVLLLLVAVPVVVIFVVPGGFMERFRLVALLDSLAWLGSGAATLYGYVRRAPPPSAVAP